MTDHDTALSQAPAWQQGAQGSLGAGMTDPAQLDGTPAMQGGLPSLTLRGAAVLVCVLYTLLTVTSSSLALLQGTETDTHLHLLARFVITLVGVGFVGVYGLLYRRFGRAPAISAALATYVLAMATVLLITWAFGRIEPLHPDAYRDITLNFTTIYVGVALLLLASAGWRRRHAN